jgi:hypothetical protein
MHKEICSIPKEIVAHQAVTSHNASGFSLQMPLIGRKQSRSSRKVRLWIGIGIVKIIFKMICALHVIVIVVVDCVIVLVVV